jgi:shikimate dehydrogenase
MNLPEPATQPTMYFIGVTTTQSSIMKVFPLWAKELGLKDAVMKGIDIGIHADPQQYRDVVAFIKNDPLSMGALVTTHKIDLYNAARDMFEYLDPHAVRFGELSSISKKDGKLEGYAKDPISSGLAMEAFIPAGFWKDHGGEVFLMGAGGSALAISSYLTKPFRGRDVPSKIIISNRSQPRLDDAKRKLAGLNDAVQWEFMLCETAEENDAVLQRVKAFSLVSNATGLGKDRPGSPLTDACRFPENSLVWELNYRGDLVFMRQANDQKNQRHLYIEDGWVYFIHGWTQVIAEVFHVNITGDVLDRCGQIARSIR